MIAWALVLISWAAIGYVIATTPEPRQHKKEVWYVAHPVSGDVKGNIQNVIRWIHWLTLNDPSRVYIAPWVAEVQAFDKDIGGAEPDAAFYDRVLADDCDVVRHLDGVLMVGGKVSRGMALERQAALDAGLKVVDLSPLREPPLNIMEDVIVQLVLSA